jgi:GT2 family glycosyltransferase
MADVPAPATPARVDWVSGAVLALRSRALADVGPLDEGFFMYSEELDLCRRLAARGWETHFVPQARVVHHEAQSSGQAVSARHVRFQRSRLRYFAKHEGAAAYLAVRAGVATAYLAEAALELGKWLAGHKRALRWERVTQYLAVVRAVVGPPSIAPGGSDGRATGARGDA